MPLPYHDDERAVLAEIERDFRPDPIREHCPYCHTLMWIDYDQKGKHIVSIYCDECGHTEELTA